MVTPRYPPEVGGVERHVQEVSGRLAAMGHAVTVLATDRSARAPERERVDGVDVRRVRAWPRTRDYYLAPGIWPEMARGTWDIVHVQSFHTFVAPLAMARALELHVPYVVTFHGGGHSSALRNAARGTQLRLLGPLLRRAARCVAVARFEIEYYGAAARIPASRFALIPNGVPVGSHRGEEASEQAPRRPLIASIGRLERYKGHDRVVAALPEVLRQEPDARLLVLGAGPEQEALRRQAESLGVSDRVEIREVRGDDPETVHALLEQVAVVVSLSRFETHPLAALEAAAAGCSLLVADHSGLHELVEDGLASGLDPGSSPAEVGEAIVGALRRRRAGAGQPAGGNAGRLPTWDDCAGQLADLYRDVVCAS